MKAIKVTRLFDVGNKDEAIIKCRVTDYMRLEDELSKSARKLFICLAGNKTGKEFPKFVEEEILSVTGLKMKAYYKAISELKEKGFIIESSPDVYQIVMPE